MSLTEHQLLQELVAELRAHIAGLPDHPWIPGAHFKDGRLMAALERSEGFLSDPQRRRKA